MGWYESFRLSGIKGRGGCTTTWNVWLQWWRNTGENEKQMHLLTSDYVCSILHPCSNLGLDLTRILPVSQVLVAILLSLVIIYAPFLLHLNA